MRKFVPLNLGDINKDGVISIADAIALQNYLLGRETFTNQSMFVRSDLDHDSRVDVFRCKTALRLYTIFFFRSVSTFRVNSC